MENVFLKLVPLMLKVKGKHHPPPTLYFFFFYMQIIYTRDFPEKKTFVIWLL